MNDLVTAVAKAIARIDEQNGAGPWGSPWCDQEENRAKARAAIEALRDVENWMLAKGYEAMFVDKWDGTQAPMIAAGFNAILDAALDDGEGNICAHLAPPSTPR